MTSEVTCRCCGKSVYHVDREPIHTACIPKHWGKHAKRLNIGKCHEFGINRKGAK